MKKPEHIISVYFDFEGFNRRKAKILIESLFEGNLKIEKYGASESKYFNIDSSNKEVLYKLLANYPRYFSGMLFLKDLKGKFLMTLEYNSFNFLRVIIFIQDDKEIYSHYQHICSIKGAIFGFLTDYDSYTNKHKLVKPSINGNGYSEEYIGQKFDNGIPGIYTNTFFSNSLGLDLEMNKFNSLNYQKKENGYYFSELDESSQVHVIQKLGANYFFDLNNHTMVKNYPKSLLERIELFKNINRKIFPQYAGDFQLNSNEQEILSSVNQICRQEEQNELLNGSCELFQKAVKPKIIQNNSLSETQIYAYGYLLGELWARRYKKRWNPIEGLTFGNSILNPYNCIIQMIEDDLDLIDMESLLNLYK